MALFATKVNIPSTNLWKYQSKKIGAENGL